MKIAVTAYVDNVDMEKFVDECNLMLYSGQVLDDRFTFVIYASPEAVPFIDKYKNTIIVPYEAKNDEYYSSYRFAKSLLFVHDNSDPLSDYDYVIKTDTDTIFTPMMNSFNFNENIYIGSANYTSYSENIEQLKDVAKKFGYFDYEKIADMHSTIICKKDDMVKLMRLSDKLCREMYYYLDEPGEWHGRQLWRGIYGTNSGICSMYALEIILSVHPYKERLIVSSQIDGSSSSNLDWKNFYHYHCYHHDFIYSKFQAKFGTYANINKQSGNSSAAYCINKYIERRDLGRNKPNLFNKPDFTIFPLPSSYIGLDLLKYSFNKDID